MASAAAELRERLGEIHDLSRAASLLAWDERTMMPDAGAESRAQQLATLAKVRHELFSSDEIGRLDRARPLGDRRQRRTGGGAGSTDADLVRVVSRDWEKARRVPSELRAEMARASSVAERAWVEAQGGLGLLDASSPTSSENVELARRYAECYEGFAGFEHPYDPLLDEYEPEMSTEQMRVACSRSCATGLVPLVARAGEPRRRAILFRGEFDLAAQRELAREVIGELPLPRGLLAPRPDRAPVRDLDRAAATCA